ncbi:MAG TPA: metallophosphoesterase family protein [Candidatus Cloacimonadota bacterium]|nr:metallophosphoesterase family protein [Candidatus Cloacimonadota bacterium]
MSDTHKNQVLLRKPFLQEKDVDYIFHLGDDYEDIDGNFDILENKQLFRVPGIFNTGYQDGSHPRCLNVQIDNWNFLLVHFLNDVISVPPTTDIVCYGHTHRSNYRELDRLFFINPGHLKREKDRGSEASYIVAELTDNTIKLHWKNLKNETILTKIIDK